jgi:cell division transport system permease protein
MGGDVIRGNFPSRQLAGVMAQNAFRLLVRGALRSWIRNLSSTAPALGSMTMLLLLTGMVGLSGYGLKNLVDIQGREASLVHVYLRDDADGYSVSALRSRLQHDSRVVRVGYVSKEQALARARGRPGLPEIAEASDTNPFPASLDVQVKRVQDVGAIDGMVRHDPAVDPTFPTSYDRGAYQRLQQVLIWVGIIGTAFMALLGFVAVTVTANSIRAAILSRHDEITIMQLVGAPRWLVRGPFVVEGAFTGGLAGLVAAVLVLALSLAAIHAGAAAFAQLAPGVTVGVALLAAAVVFASGLGLGSGSSLVGIRRHLET